MLNDIFKEPKQKFTYLFDFGEDWFHIMILEEIMDKQMTHADCIDGKGTCPPDDCGRPGGYERHKHLVKFTGRPENDEMREWLKLGKGQFWNADNFDLE